MTSPDLATAELEVCPYLGLPDDPPTRFTFADPAHRCHVGAKPIAIGLGYQGAYCLTTGYPACKRFRLPRAAGSQGSSPASTLGSSLGPAVGVTALSSPDSRTGEGRSRGRAPRRVGSLVAIVAFVAVVGAIRAGVIGGSPADGGAPGGVASPAGATPLAPTPVTSGSTATSAAGLRSTPAPTATSVATGTPRSAPIIHVVVRGENLISIAAYFGVTVKAIQDANNIANPSLIRIGDRLVIPPPP